MCILSTKKVKCVANPFNTLQNHETPCKTLQILAKPGNTWRAPSLEKVLQNLAKLIKPLQTYITLKPLEKPGKTLKTYIVFLIHILDLSGSSKFCFKQIRFWKKLCICVIWEDPCPFKSFKFRGPTYISLWRKFNELWWPTVVNYFRN